VYSAKITAGSRNTGFSATSHSSSATWLKTYSVIRVCQHSEKCPIGSSGLYLASANRVYRNQTGCEPAKSMSTTLPRTQLGPPDRLPPPVARRQGILQHFPDCLPRQPKLPGYRTPAPAFHQNRPPHTRIQVHVVHTSGVPRKTHLSVDAEPRCEPGSLPLKVSVVRETRMWRDGLLLFRHAAPLTRRDVDYFCSGAHTRQNVARKCGRILFVGINYRQVNNVRLPLARVEDFASLRIGR
jgi:hypothetical protein